MIATPTFIDLKPLTIGHLIIDPPLTLAPMAGQTNYAFRRLCREMGGCGLVCTELISSEALSRKGSRERTLELFDWRADESPFAVQLFGSDPYTMAEAAKMIVDHGADIVDINMGCWVPKIAKKGAGAALLRDVCTAATVVQAVVDAVPSTPVTVKIRTGWEPHNPTAVPFAKAAAQIGVKAIAIHARFANQGFTGEVDWNVIKQVKEAVSDIPVIGNGDVVNAHTTRRMFELTGCDAVMIGRGALGNPWVFRQIMDGLSAASVSDYSATLTDRAQTAIYHAHLTLETTQLPQIKAIRELRGQMLKYCENMPDATTVRDHISRAESLADIEYAFKLVI